MTAILNELRILESRVTRGELTRAQYAARRAALLQSVEEAQSDFEPAAPRRGPKSRASSASALGLSIAVCFGIMALTTGAVLLLLPDLDLALTVGVTLLAALSVALLRGLDR